MIWVSLTIMIATIAISCALLRNWRGDALGIPLVAIGSFAFLYVIQPLQLLMTGTNSLFLTDWQMSKALLVPALMLACFMWGWMHPGRPKLRQSAPWDLKLMWILGFWAACLGLVLYVVFIERSGGFAASYSEAHGHAMAWEQNTAYLYFGPWLILSGAVMMFLGSERGKRWRTLVPHAFLALFLLSGIVTGSRGPTFAGAMTYFVGLSIVRRRQVKLERAVGWLLVVGCAVVIVFAYRARLHLGSDAGATQSPSEAANSLIGTSEYDQEHDVVAQEFIIHAAVIETVDQTGKLDYGFKWISWLVINPIPKLLWPEKAYPTGPGITTADIKEQTSLWPAFGSAAGIVADLYTEFHLLSAVLFYCLGLGFRRLFLLARNFSSPVTTVGYIMIYGLSLNIFAQGLLTFVVPVCYSMVPVMLYSLVATGTRRKARHHQRVLILHRAGTIHPQAAASRGEQWSS
jgi:hypothetical protein